MDLQSLQSEACVGAAVYVLDKGSQPLWNRLAPHVKPAASRYLARLRADFRTHKPFWAAATMLTGASWMFGIWYEITGSVKGDNVAAAFVLSFYVWSGLAILILANRGIQQLVKRSR